jgi:hypothetical protein
MLSAVARGGAGRWSGAIGRYVMDWSWLPPALFGVLVALGVTWVQHYWEDRRRRSAERRARMEQNFGVLREYIASVSDLANHLLEGELCRESWDQEPDGSGARREWARQWGEMAHKVLRSPVSTTPGVFVKDDRLLAQLNAIDAVMREWMEWGRRWLSREDSGNGLFLQTRLDAMIVIMQLGMDELVDEL